MRPHGLSCSISWSARNASTSHKRFSNFDRPAGPGPMVWVPVGRSLGPGDVAWRGHGASLDFPYRWVVYGSYLTGQLHESLLHSGRQVLVWVPNASPKTPSRSTA
ncbi:hypothetical protein TWF103_010299 [Orbilia oligospora]|nr:hypothetical protein TWF103_010299 [Orbilia oligospora]